MDVTSGLVLASDCMVPIVAKGLTVLVDDPPFFVAMTSGLSLAVPQCFGVALSEAMLSSAEADRASGEGRRLGV